MSSDSGRIDEYTGINEKECTVKRESRIKEESTPKEEPTVKEEPTDKKEPTDKEEPTVKEELTETYLFLIRIQQLHKKKNSRAKTKQLIDIALEFSNEFFQDKEAVQYFLGETEGYWMRLEENIWATPIKGRRCCLIEQTVEDDKDMFEIGLYSTDITIDKNNNTNTEKPFKMIQSYGKDINLAKVYQELLKAQVTPPKFFYNEKFTCSKEFIMDLNKSFIDDFVRENKYRQKSVEKFFRNELHSLRVTKLRYLLLASLYSPNSIYAHKERTHILNLFTHKHGNRYNPDRFSIKTS